MDDTFANTVQYLACIEHIPTRLILAHLVHFNGVSRDLVLKLADEYGHANAGTLSIIEEYTDNQQ